MPVSEQTPPFQQFWACWAPWIRELSPGGAPEAARRGMAHGSRHMRQESRISFPFARSAPGPPGPATFLGDFFSDLLQAPSPHFFGDSIESAEEILIASGSPITLLSPFHEENRMTVPVFGQWHGARLLVVPWHPRTGSVFSISAFWSMASR